MISAIRPRSHQDYVSLPIIGPILDEFATWSHERGYALHTICNQLRATRHIATFFQQEGLRLISELTHIDFQIAWQHFRQEHPNIAGTARRLQQFLDETRRLPAPLPIPKTRSEIELERFAGYLKDVKGLVDITIRSHISYLGRFLDSIGFETNEQAIVELNLKQVEGFLGTCSADLNRYSLQHVVGYLRAFLRFEYSRGVLRIPLHEMIDTPRVYRLEKLPRSLPWTVVNELLVSIDRTDTHGIRNYAMLFLVATYGLRSCEVVSLTLDDINWRAATMCIHQGKTDNHFVLPLTDAVADALINYLKNGRPNLSFREVFLRIRAPNGRLKPTAVAEAFQRQVRLSGMDIPYHGAHCLRHSFAVHLLRGGTSAKAIGDVIGHRNAESTSIYLRLSIDDLRSVALDVPDCANIDAHVDATALEGLPPPKSWKKGKPGIPLQSFLAQEITAYLQLHHSLGKVYRSENATLRSLDAFLAIQRPWAEELTGKLFNKWCNIFADLSPTVRRNRMRAVRNFCLYRRRSILLSFIPDILTFPANHSQFIPYILSSADVARLLCIAQQLPALPRSPLRPQVIRLAIMLLYTSGLRRGELLRLTLGDFNSKESTLFIRCTKFHKERIIPLSATADAELRAYLNERQRCALPMNASSPIIWNNARGPEGRAYSGTGFALNWKLLCASLKILTPKGTPPRIHDIRHSFAVNALLRWYHDGEDVSAKLPQLSTYMGHVDIVSTHCYLPFVESLRRVAGTRFEQKYGNLISDLNESTKPKKLKCRGSEV